MLTELEVATLMKKAGVISSLLEVKKWEIVEREEVFDPIQYPGEWDHGDKDNYGFNTIHQVTMNDLEFVVVRRECYDPDNSDNNWEDYLIFSSQGEKKDDLLLLRKEYGDLLVESPRHLPEAISEWREEYSDVMREGENLCRELGLQEAAEEMERQRKTYGC